VSEFFGNPEKIFRSLFLEGLFVLPRKKFVLHFLFWINNLKGRREGEGRRKEGKWEQGGRGRRATSRTPCGHVHCLSRENGGRRQGGGRKKGEGGRRRG
jgi:hypothetical protein